MSNIIHFIKQITGLCVNVVSFILILNTKSVSRLLTLTNDQSLFWRLYINSVGELRRESRELQEATEGVCHV